MCKQPCIIIRTQSQTEVATSHSRSLEGNSVIRLSALVWVSKGVNCQGVRRFKGENCDLGAEKRCGS